MSSEVINALIGISGAFVLGLAVIAIHHEITRRQDPRQQRSSSILPLLGANACLIIVILLIFTLSAQR